MNKLQIETLLERIKRMKSLKSDKDVALLLGLSPQDFSNRKKRNTLRPLILEWAAEEGMSLGWIVCEEEEPYGRRREEAEEGGIEREILRLVIEAVERGSRELGIYPEAGKKAELIVTLYEMHRKHKEIDRQVLLSLLRLAG